MEKQITIRKSVLAKIVAACHDSKTETPGGTGLHFLVMDKFSDIETIKYLVEACPELLSAQDNYGDTPLHIAFRHVKYEYAEYLISKGADKTAKNKTRETPLQVFDTRINRYGVPYTTIGSYKYGYTEEQREKVQEKLSRQKERFRQLFTTYFQIHQKLVDY